MQRKKKAMAYTGGFCYIYTVMKFRSITSTLNPHIQDVGRMRQKRSFSRDKTFLIEGPHLVEMALSVKAAIQKVFFTQQFLSRKDGQRLLQDITKDTQEIYEVTDHLLRKIADAETPQGIVAVVSYKSLTLNDLAPERHPLYVIIDGIQDPGNLGTIIRTADASGAHAVIVTPGTCDVFMPKTVRATAGSIFTVPVLPVETEVLLKWLKASGIILMATAQDGDLGLFDSSLDVPLALVFGNEAHGVGAALKKAASHSLRIPIYGKAESLNVSVSAAVCLYEAARQRNLAR